jgi:hypothetical protein
LRHLFPEKLLAQTLTLYGESHPTRIAQSGPTIWIRLNAPRSPERGYREISVSEEPLRTDAAILAALTALEGRPLDVGALHEVLTRILPLRKESFFERWTKALKDLRHHQTLDYASMLLRYHSPGFDDLPLEERADLVGETCAHINEFVEVLFAKRIADQGSVSAKFPITECSEVGRA